MYVHTYVKIYIVAISRFYVKSKLVDLEPQNFDFYKLYHFLKPGNYQII